MNAEASGADDAKTDPFEVATGFLLGLAAVGAALASLQAGQWGGKQLEAFSQSNTMQTLASRDYNEAVASMNADYAIVATAKQLLIEAAQADTDAEEERKLRVVSYLYSEQLTWQAMKALGLPEALWSAERTEEGEEAPEAGAAAAPAADAAAPEPTPAPAAAAAPAADDEDEEGDEEHAAAEPTHEAAPAADGAVAAAAAPADETSAGEAAIDAALSRMLDEELLWGTIDVELHDEDSSYGDDLFGEPIQKFDEADAKFREGQTANDNGDKFDLAGVYYTVALFFAGLGLVFKSKIRWPFFGVGFLGFLGTTVFMMTLPWAG